MATVHYLDLPKEWEGFEVPKAIQKHFGSKNRSKCVIFTDHYQVSNDDYDQFMAIPPQRQNGENDEDYKRRSELRKVLSKYKSDFYDYSVYSKSEN